MPSALIESNDRSRRRLEAVVRSLSDQDLARPTSDGWTVSALLAHLAFWDQRMIVLLRRWKVAGVEPSPIDPDMTNDALQPLCLRLPAQAAIDLCLSSAQTIDAELESLSAGLIEQIEASGTHFRFDRALHRDDHLSQIESHLGRRPGDGGA